MEHRIIKIAILGLSLSILNGLKQKINEAMPKGCIASWTSVSDPNTAILFVNEVFFSSPSISNVIEKLGASVLKVNTSSSERSIIQNATLYYPIDDLTALSQWLAQRVAADVTPSDLSSQNQHTRQQPSSPRFSPLFSDLDPAELLEKLLNPTNGKIILFDNKGVFGCADTRTGFIWADGYATRAADRQFNFNFATLSESIKFASKPPHELHNWLWNLLWNTPELVQLEQITHGSYQLLRWPQPDPHAKAKPHAVIRMSACFAQGASIQTVAKYLDFPENTVKRFVATSLMLGMITPITKESTLFDPDKDKVKEKETSAVGRFFGSLRRKFGF